MDVPGRRYLCARCRTAVVICSHCDRGHRYCSLACADQARCTAVRAAGCRYQATRRGRHAHAERWPVGTIARPLNLHRDSVARVLAQAGLPALKQIHRPSAIDVYLPFILETLTQFPRLRASRLYDMVKNRGYPGRPDHFRHLIARHRPRPKAEAFLRLRTLPGEQIQIDWGHFGHLEIGHARRPLMAFVAVLSWSRQIFLRFYLGAHMENFLRGHVGAFAAWGGCPRVALYDNLKSAVLERQGTAIRFNPTLLALAGHYPFDPRPVAVARGNEKGRVERAIRTIRDAFFAGRPFKDLDDLNAQADAWVIGQAGERRCPEDETRTVSETFAQERTRLLTLPGETFPTDEIRAVSAGKTPYVRFDLNDYSIPHTCVARTLTVAASPDQVRVLDGATLIAAHPRSYDRRQQIELPEHLATLVLHKHQAAAHRGTDRRVQAVPSCQALLEQAAERGEPLGRTVHVDGSLGSLRGGRGTGTRCAASECGETATSQGGTAGQWLGELAGLDSDSALRYRLRRYAAPDLLVIDEVGYLSYSNRHADLLFELINRRHEKKSTLITTNKAFSEWSEVFPGASCGVAMIDRLVHHAEILSIKGDSYRRKEAQERAVAQSRKRKTKASP